MKILRYMVMAVLFMGLTHAARAYQVLVLDPSTADSPFFLIQPGVPFSFGFADCNVSYGGFSYTGCALGFNDSDHVITNISLGYANTLGNLPVQCLSDAFSDFSCGLSSDGTEYALSFEDACGTNSCGIAPYHFVVLLENAVPGSDFPDVDGVANSPEPGSIWLALSGLGSVGYLVRRRRKV
ncbi:MAG TPA: PEP-CTERM sorting domain-containing protein [Acidobacteriaceae bacterium]|nr:PEP-CTERM sorting domain-containing protein [Acidobacteriaceae bacterium]